MTRHDWQLVAEDDPTRTHWCDPETGLPSVTIFSKPSDNYRSPIIERIEEEHHLSGHVIIEAPNVGTADNVHNLIHGGVLLAYPDPQNVLLKGEGVIQDSFPHTLANEPFYTWFQQYDHTYYGCQVADRAWGNRALIYAIEKYKLSLQLDCFTPHSAHPDYGQSFDHTYPLYQSRVSAAFAVIAADSAIEELGFEVRSSRKNPRFIDKKWNPVVLQDLDERLQRANMNVSKKFHWTYRGNPTAIENEMVRTEPEFGTESKYYGVSGGEVRDREIMLADAIHLVSWLRNFITAHKFSSLTEAISPYDVHNCQRVARQLIIGALNI